MKAGLAISLCAFALAAGASSQTSAPSLTALTTALAHPQLAQAASPQGVWLTWHGLRFLFGPGDMVITEPGAPVTTAVLDGAGWLQVQPANANERGQMLRYLGQAPTEVRFTAAVFRVGSRAAWLQAFSRPVAWTPLRDIRAAERVLAELDKINQREGDPDEGRLLRGLDSPRAAAVLFAWIRLESGEWVQVEFDPLLAQPALLFSRAEGVPEVATQFAPQGFAPIAAPQLGHVQVKTTLTGHFDLDASAQFSVASAGHGILLALDPALKVTSVTSADGSPLAWARPDHADWLYVRLSPASAAATVAVNYAGPAPLERAQGEPGGVSVPDWFPALPLDWPAVGSAPPTTFDLQFTTDKKYTLLASGARAALTEAGDTSTTAWRSTQPVRSVGFALGEDAEDTRQVQLADGRTVSLRLAVPAKDAATLTPLVGTKWLDVMNFLDARLGPYPWPQASVWLAAASADAVLPPPAAGLLPLDPASFLDVSNESAQFTPAFLAAGQWFGAWTVPATPADDWLVAGLRSASGWWYQQARYGPDAGAQTLLSWYHYLTYPESGVRGVHVPSLAGPMLLGADRLSSSVLSGDAVLTAKGGFGIEMLRAMMFADGKPDPDAAFTAMLRKFMARYGGQPVTAAEFQAVAEKYMTPAMDLDGNHKLDWYFLPLETGTAVPKINFQAKLAAVVAGKAQIAMTVDNPDGWRGLLPVYIFQDATHYLRGILRVTQNHLAQTVAVPFTPQYVDANHFHEMLLDVVQ